MRLLRTCSILILCASIAAAATPELPPTSREAGGPLRIEAGRPLRLYLKLADRAAFCQRVRALAHELAPAAAVEPSETVTAPIEVTLHWIDPAAPLGTLRFHDGVVEVPVPAGAARVAHYTLEWTDPAGRLAVRLPAANEGYAVQIVEPGPSRVVVGSGTTDLALFGEEVPLNVEIADQKGVATATVYLRSSAAEHYTTQPMALDSGEPQRGVWKAGLRRPQSAEATLDYYVEILSRAGPRTLYGSETIPFHLHLPDPTTRP